MTNPASIINVPLKFSDGSTLNLKEAQQRFSRPVFGGLERLGVIAKAVSWRPRRLSTRC